MEHRTLDPTSLFEMFAAIPNHGGRRPLVSDFIDLPDNPELRDAIHLRHTLLAAQLGAKFAENSLRSGGGEAEAKANIGDVVSKADKIADLMACYLMHQYYPDAVVIGEETSPDETPVVGRRFGTVDGLDGSAAAVAGLHGQYGTMVGLADMISEELVRYIAAAVVQPSTLNAFCAETGKGAWKNSGVGTPYVRLEGLKPGFGLERGHVVFNRQRFDRDEDPRVTKLLCQMRDPRNLGRIPQQVRCDLPSSVMGLDVFDQHSAVVAVVHDSSSESAKQKIWDKLPIFVIGNEVEGVVIRTLDDRPASLFRDEPFVVAASREIYEKVLSLLQ
ncbi:hypothetical protein KBD59_02020 [Candidatus Gracilibacteria bacterium]|nr:hypothetical protein [Candidatus Gracilibacteria bacterium]